MQRVAFTCLLAVLLMGLSSTPVVAIGSTSGGNQTGIAPPPDGCPEIDTSILTRQSSLVHTGQQVQLACHLGQAFYPNHSDASHAASSAGAAGVGDPCQVSWFADVRISQLLPDGTRSARWDDPPGPEPTAGAGADANLTVLSTALLAGNGLGAAQADLYRELVYAEFDRAGSWDGGRCAGGTWQRCQHRIVGGPADAGPGPCIVTTAYAARPPDCQAACEAPVQALVARLDQETVAGTVERWPAAAAPPRIGAIVNLPVQFYIPDWRLNGRQQASDSWRLSLVGPPDDHGRSLAFEYVVTLGLLGVDWDFGDGQGAHFGDAGGFGRDVHPPQGSSPVTHAYQTVSRDHPYRVQATESWGVRVDKYWLGGHQEVPRLERRFQVQTATPVEVGQVEAIPVAG